ncbi:diadenylate cyclase CdaA [Streptococcus caprae]|uniref:Diadenylate cyclase n=1 Tax=Streptococcus caprae TaxID=1640501 RepID=A0ABV8CVJ1_9STRE
MSSLFSADSSFWSTIFASPWSILIHVIDILIVAWLIYKFIKSMAGSKIMSLVLGIVLFIALRFVAELVGLTTIAYLMNQVVTYGVIAVVVIFAPEIRTALEKFGRTPQQFLQNQNISEEERLVSSLVKAAQYMAPRKIGALISIERNQTLREYIDTGIPLDADISSQLLINIFIPNTPLHDGAVIIKGKKIASACSYLPLSESTNISKEFGTRHRAAIGLGEHSDAVTLIISEETGAISLAYKNHFLHALTLDKLEQKLSELFVPTEINSSWLQQLLRRFTK